MNVIEDAIAAIELVEPEEYFTYELSANKFKLNKSTLSLTQFT